MSMRKKTNRRKNDIMDSRAKRIKTGKFTRKGTEQVYKRGGNRTSFPYHTIISSENNFGDSSIKNTGDNNSGWINERTGEPYSGPIHYHYGRAMVGAVHTSEQHDYLIPSNQGGISGMGRRRQWTPGGYGAPPPTIEKKRARKRRKVKRKPRRGRDNL